MTAREWTLAALLAVAIGLIVAGVADFSDEAAKIAAGVLLAGWAWLVLGEVE